MTTLDYKPTLRAIILPVVFYGPETWSATSRKEHRLRVFNKRVFFLRRSAILGFSPAIILHNVESILLTLMPSHLTVHVTYINALTRDRSCNIH